MTSAWNAISNAAKHVKGVGFLYVMVALVAFPAISISFFQGKWEYALVGGLLSLLFAVPAVVFSHLPRITAGAGFKTAALAMIWSYLGASLCVIGLLISTAVFRWPYPISVVLGLSASEKTDSPVAIEWSTDPKRKDQLPQRPYVLPSVTEYLRFEPANKKPDSMAVSDRVFYSILAIDDLQPRPDLFQEGFDSVFGSSEAYHWYGSRPDNFKGKSVVPAGKFYSVDISAKKQSVLPLVTGADYVFNLNDPVRTSRKPYDDYPTQLAANEDFWEYPNKEDYIHHFAFIIDSQGYKIRLISSRCIRQPNIDLKPVFKKEKGPTEDQKGNYAVSVEWEDVIPGDVLYVVFARE